MATPQPRHGVPVAPRLVIEQPNGQRIFLGSYRHQQGDNACPLAYSLFLATRYIGRLITVHN